MPHRAGPRASAGATAAAERPTRITGSRGLASPSTPAALGAALLLGVAAVGWLLAGGPVAAAFGAAWLPDGPVVPVTGVLSGLVVAIDPGHGGFDPGVITDSGVVEADLNLAVSLKLRDILVRAGAEVFLTRTEDRDLLQPGDSQRHGSAVRAELIRRVEAVKRAGADLLVSLHCNSFPSSVWRGAQTFYMPGAHPGGRFLAEAIQGELVRVTGETDRQPNGRQDIFLIRETDAPAVVVEMGFLSNPRDLALLQDPDYQHLIAMAIFFGICRFVHQPPPGTA
ncbi:MAG TPA: N-acetylmuramoyl-L-alanine amidase CwlD [Clostridiales bacterium]|nr:N-acetylmuramoyl-L-alanine amidase CwlD [Clostridiales bacterium]